MASFGQILRQYRRQCRDPHRSGPLTQERLGELLGQFLGDAGYSGAAVSEWERDKSKIDEDNRPVLLGLIATLSSYGGLASAAEANTLLHAGNYRGLNTDEQLQLFPDQDRDPVFNPPYEPTSSPSQLPVSKERRKLLILLEKVKSFWVEGVLEKAAPGQDGAIPEYRLADDSVARPWEGIVPSVDAARRPDVRQDPLALYENGDRSLLILGEPGSGKTIMMLSLARSLIEQAERDPSLPVPAVLNLVTWAKRRQSLAAWAIEELTAKYMIPRRTGREWLEDDDLVLLLDGFDDVPKRLRRRCAQTINDFRASHGLCGIVVCCRTKAYAQADTKLKLGTAVELQPLREDQVDDYLQQHGARLASLGSAVERDATLRTMARNPLMLSIMSAAYDDSERGGAVAKVEAPFSGPAPMSTRRQRLFDMYVNSMFGRRTRDTTFSIEQTTRWLSWLASQTIRFQQSPFMLEEIQPIWLASRRWRWIYLMVSGLIAGLFTAFIVWMLLQILRLPTPQLGSETAQFVASRLNFDQGWAEAVTLVSLNAVLGLAFALLQGRYFESVRAMPEEPDLSSWTYRRHLALVVLVTGGLVLAIANVLDRVQFALAWATAEAFIFFIIARFVFGAGYNSEIRTLESLGWSWPSALRGLGVGLLAAAAFEAMDTLIFENDGVHLSIIIPAAGGMVLGGMRGRRVEVKSRPNQGILLSLRNSFIAATVSGLILAALALYVQLKQPYAAQYALRTGLLTFMIAGALFGGGNVIKHYLVRLLLWLHKDLPLDVIRLLNEAAELVFLRKVGGGYIFIHRLLQQYFASLHQPPIEDDAEQLQLVSDPRQITSSGSN